VAVEWVVLVDDDDRELAVARKDEVHHAATPLHRGFSLFLFDDAGRTLLQRRAESKRTWPGVWSNACCGHPDPGESAADAARRRCRHELGVEPLDLEVALPRFRYRAEAGGVVENELCPVLVGRLGGGPLTPRTEEIAETRWLDWRTFLAELPAAYSPWAAEEAPRLEAEPRFRDWLAAARVSGPDSFTGSERRNRP
jgi:isopentenyl-diphosphate delta-isomerase type 1